MNIKEYKNCVLRLEYDKYVGIIDKLRRHIHLSDKNNNISTNDKNVYLNELFEILKKLNIIYNACVISPDISDENDLLIVSLNEQKNFELMYSHIERLRVIKKNTLLFSDKINIPLNDIKDLLKVLVNNIGMENIESIINLYTNNSYDESSRRLFEFYNKIFFPLSVSEIKVSNSIDNDINFNLFNENIFIKKNINFINCNAEINIIFLVNIKILNEKFYKENF